MVGCHSRRDDDKITQRIATLSQQQRRRLDRRQRTDVTYSPSRSCAGDLRDLSTGTHRFAGERIAPPLPRA
jgi:hypothetical protein